MDRGGSPDRVAGKVGASESRIPLVVACPVLRIRARSGLWIPVFAGMTITLGTVIGWSLMDSRFRGNNTAIAGSVIPANTGIH